MTNHPYCNYPHTHDTKCESCDRLNKIYPVQDGEVKQTMEKMLQISTES